MRSPQIAVAGYAGRCGAIIGEIDYRLLLAVRSRTDCSVCIAFDSGWCGRSSYIGMQFVWLQLEAGQQVRIDVGRNDCVDSRKRKKCRVI